jgi:hypothetical protein
MATLPRFTDSMDELFQRLVDATNLQGVINPSPRLRQQHFQLQQFWRPDPGVSYRHLETTIDRLFFAVLGEGHNLGLHDEPHPNPAPTESVHKLPVVPAPKSDSCSICLESYTQGTQMKRLPCQHYYHPACIDQWLAQDHRCPICRNNITQVDSGSNTASPLVATEPTATSSTSPEPALLTTWDFNINLTGATYPVLIRLAQRYGLSHNIQPRRLLQSLEHYRSTWLQQQPTRELLKLVRQLHLGDRIYQGMDRTELTGLLESSQGGAHLRELSVSELLTLCRWQDLRLQAQRCLEKSDLINLLLSTSRL